MYYTCDEAEVEGRNVACTHRELDNESEETRKRLEEERRAFEEARRQMVKQTDVYVTFIYVDYNT